MKPDTLKEFMQRGLKAQQAVDNEIERHRQSRVINRDYVRRWALDYAQHRHHKFERVSERFLNRVETYCKAAIRDMVDSHPSKGKTLL